MVVDNAHLIEEAWRRFTSSGELSDVVPQVVRDSWAYCRSIGLDPINPAPGHYERRDLASLYQENKFLHMVAHTTVTLLKEVITGTDFLVTLANAAGEILEIVGDPEVVDNAKENNYVPGASRSARATGTNAISLACDLGIPIKASGAEHYHLRHHNWSCAAAPIIDTAGKLLGVICFSGKVGRIHQHTLGMAVAAARAIEREIIITEANQSLAKNTKLVEAVIKSMERGFVIVDCQGKILKLNPASCGLFGVSEDQLVGKLIQDYLRVPNHDITSNEGVISLKSYSEATVHTESRPGLPVFVQGALLFDEEEQPIARVFLLEERRAVHRMAQKIAGNSAHFIFDDIVARNPAMLEAINVAKSYSRYHSRVLIQGESGVGKEMFAQAIHNASPRANEPFVAINCAAIPRDLIESEFFGHVDGAFTGAKRGGRPGKVELAHRGTLFLDEVHHMPHDMQIKLLRFLQEKSFVRLGGNEETRVDARVVSAGNVVLEDEVRKGNFRSDLYYRLSTAIVNIPPIRERPEDIEALVEVFLSRKSNEIRKNDLGPDQRSMGLREGLRVARQCARVGEPGGEGDHGRKRRLPYPQGFARARARPKSSGRKWKRHALRCGARTDPPDPAANRQQQVARRPVAGHIQKNTLLQDECL